MTGARLFVVAALLAGLLAGCDNKPVAGAAPPPPPVTVSKAIQKPITEWDEYTGRFVPIATVEVRARVSGFIDSIHFKDGQIVKKDDLLFVIDQRPYQIAVEQAKPTWSVRAPSLMSPPPMSTVPPRFCATRR